jgi:curli production assembly/transport component CsgE
MPARSCALVFAMTLLAAVPASAQEDSRPASADALGIVVNETFTSGGQEFYRRFTDFWREKPDFESYTLVVTERPSRRYGNRITVTYERQVVFAGNLPLKLDAIRALSADAAEKVNANVISLGLRMTGDADPDMAKDGF